MWRCLAPLLASLLTASAAHGWDARVLTRDPATAPTVLEAVAPNSDFVTLWLSVTLEAGATVALAVAIEDGDRLDWADPAWLSRLDAVSAVRVVPPQEDQCPEQNVEVTLLRSAPDASSQLFWFDSHDALSEWRDAGQWTGELPETANDTEYLAVRFKAESSGYSPTLRAQIPRAEWDGISSLSGLASAQRILWILSTKTVDADSAEFIPASQLGTRWFFDEGRSDYAAERRAAVADGHSVIEALDPSIVFSSRYLTQSESLLTSLSSSEAADCEVSTDLLFEASSCTPGILWGADQPCSAADGESCDLQLALQGQQAAPVFLTRLATSASARLSKSTLLSSLPSEPVLSELLSETASSCAERPPIATQPELYPDAPQASERVGSSDPSVRVGIDIYLYNDPCAAGGCTDGAQGASSEDCASDSSDAYYDEEDPSLDAYDASGEDCTGDTSDSYAYEDTSSTDEDCGGDTYEDPQPYEGEEDCASDSSESYESSDDTSCESDYDPDGDFEGEEECAVRTRKKRRIRFSAWAVSLAALSLVLRRQRGGG